MLLTLVALGLRAYRLDAVGLSEDEAHKFQATQAYRAGDFTPNAEHPMLMKTLVTLSAMAAEQWNATVTRHHSSLTISEETALRLPNVLFGALTTIVLFLFAREMFNPLTGWITAVLWATGINAIAVNRIAKEDTLLVFFTWLGYHFFLKAKHEGPVESGRRERFYILSGLSFGLMLASKYFIHYMGLYYLYNYLRPHDPQTNYPLGKRTMIKFFAAFFLAFALANPMLFHPKTLHYLVVYVSERIVPHHGYEMMGHLYYNNAWKFSNATPLYFYPLFLFVKVPPVLILAFVIGLVLIIRKPWPRTLSPTLAMVMCGVVPISFFLADWVRDVLRLQSMLLITIVIVSLSLIVGLMLVKRGSKEDGPLFLRFMLVFWIIPFTAFGSKWLRYTLALMPMVYMTAAVGIAAGCYKIRALPWPSTMRQVAASLVLAVFLLVPAWTAFANRPYYLLYVNALGGGKDRRAYYFPHDEIYDAGLREAIGFIAYRAPSGSLVAQDAPGVAEFYLQKYKRTDLVAIELSSRNFNSAQISPDAPAYVIVQKGRRYFENQAWLDYIERHYQPVKEIWIDGVRTTRVYEIERSPSG